MPTIDRLVALTLESIARQPIDKGFEQAMTRLLTQAHTAALLAGTAERTGKPADSGLFKGLSRAERADIKTAIQTQLGYLAKFKTAMPNMSDEAIRNRASLYSGSVRSTYNSARWGDWELPFVPTQGTPCGGRCKCSIAVTDNGDGTGSMVWSMGGVESVHCNECPSREAGSPYQVRRKNA